MSPPVGLCVAFPIVWPVTKTPSPVERLCVLSGLGPLSLALHARDCSDKWIRVLGTMAKVGFKRRLKNEASWNPPE